jgi:hypothetical protein
MSKRPRKKWAVSSEEEEGITQRREGKRRKGVGKGIKFLLCAFARNWRYTE